MAERSETHEVSRQPLGTSLLQNCVSSGSGSCDMFVRRSGEWCRQYKSLRNTEAWGFQAICGISGGSLGDSEAGPQGSRIGQPAYRVGLFENRVAVQSRKPDF
jgi:hypothetical protein